MNSAPRKSIDGVRVKRTKRTSSIPRSFPDEEMTISPPVIRTPRTLTSRVLERREQSKRQNSLLLFLQKKWTARMILGCLTLLFLFLFLHHRHTAKLVVRPHFEWVEVSDTATLSHNALPGQLPLNVMVVSESVSLPVIAEGVREVYEYASGTVTLYNDHSTEPQRLLPETRFASAGGKIFHLGSEEIIIPGKTTEGPGEVGVTIYASEPGESYNLDVTDFTIPGFRELGLDDRYRSIYAVSREQFSGGAIRQEPYITEVQELTLHDELVLLLQEKFRQRIDYEKTDSMRMISGTMPTELHDPEIIIGEDNESFIVQQGQTMVFFVEENVLIEYLYRQYVVSDYPDTEFFRLDHLRLQGSQSSSFEIPSSLSVNLEARFLVRSLIDETKLQDILNGQLKQDLLPLLENQSDIDIAEVSLRPFWRKRIPEEVEHIHIRQKW